MRQRLRINRDASSIATRMMPLMRMANGIAIGANIVDPEIGSSTENTLAGRNSQRKISRIRQLIPKIEFSEQFIHRFHFNSQMAFFFGFATFCLFYFLVYPTIHTSIIDAACDKKKAEWYAEIHK
jgi:hypothetical protein